MTDLTDYAENQLLNAMFDNVVGDLPVVSVYVKLHLGDPGEDATANAAVEVTRQGPISGAVAVGVYTSDAAITWTSVSTTETYSHVSLWDAATIGNALAKGALTASKAVNSGDTFTIASGDLTVTLD